MRIGGKTATSQTLPRGTGKYIASFVGFAPADDPEIIAMAIITHPTGTYYGGQIAAPVVKQLFENILPYLGIMDYNKIMAPKYPLKLTGRAQNAEYQFIAGSSGICVKRGDGTGSHPRS